MKQINWYKYLETAQETVRNIKCLSTTSYSKEGVAVAQFSYRHHFSIKLDRNLLDKFKKLENEIGITPYILSRGITVLKPGDYINWTSKPKESIGVGNVLVFSITDNIIEFENGVMSLKAGQAIKYCPKTKYRVSPVEKTQIGIIWIVPYWLELS